MFRAVRVMVLGLFLMLVVPAISFAQATPIFPVSSDLAQVKTDILAWAVALLGVALAIYAYRRVKSIAR